MSKSWELDWERDFLLDSYSANTTIGSYYCMRTAFDVAVLYHNNKVIRRSASDGGHMLNRIFAEEHYQEQSENLHVA
jgi:hypothetical protein